MRIAALGAIVLLLLVVPAAAAEETVEVAAEGARLRSDHSPSASVVVTLAAGTVLTVLDTEGEWYRVKTPAGQKGWISKSVVRKPGKIGGTAAPAATPTPGQGTGSWKSTGVAVREGFSARRSSEVPASVGARGIKEGGGGGKPDPTAVKKMDSWVPTRDEVRAFIREGGLSPERMP
jgi:hypothetical protein